MRSITDLSLKAIAVTGLVTILAACGNTESAKQVPTAPPSPAAQKESPAPQEPAAKPAPPTRPERPASRPDRPMGNHDKEWGVQAKTIAQQLGLSAEQTEKLTQAYADARRGLQTATAEKFGQRGGGRPDFAAMREVSQTEKAKFETAVKAFLSPENVSKVMATLGSFNRRWDMMTAALGQMGLSEEINSKALALVADYVAETGSVTEGAAAGDFQALREKMQPMKDKLDGELAKILAPDQLEKWKEYTSRRGGMRGGMPHGGPQQNAPQNSGQ